MIITPPKTKTLKEKSKPLYKFMSEWTKNIIDLNLGLNGILPLLKRLFENKNNNKKRK